MVVTTPTTLSVQTSKVMLTICEDRNQTKDTRNLSKNTGHKEVVIPNRRPQKQHKSFNFKNGVIFSYPAARPV